MTSTFLCKVYVGPFWHALLPSPWQKQASHSAGASSCSDILPCCCVAVATTSVQPALHAPHWDSHHSLQIQSHNVQLFLLHYNLFPCLREKLKKHHSISKNTMSQCSQKKLKNDLLLFLFFRRVLREARARFRPPLCEAPRRCCGSCCGLMGCASEKAGAEGSAKGLTSEVEKWRKLVDFLLRK